jgi:hypothetical protein
MNRTFSLLLNLFVTFVVGACICSYATASTPAIHKTATPVWVTSGKSYDKKPLARDVADGAYSELIEEEINVEEKATYNHFITAIVSEAGVQDNSTISISFDPSFERVDFHKLIVWRNNKPQDRLDIAAFKMLPEEDELDKFIYNGTYSAKYILADIRKGDKIEYSYTVTGQNPIFKDKFCRSIYLQGSDPILHQYTTLLFSSARKLKMKPFNLRSQPKISKVKGLIMYEWEDLNVPGVATNKFEPGWVNDYARVQVSEFNTWADVVNWGLSINPLETSFEGELADSIAGLKKQFGNNQDKYFRAAVTLVQNEVRYMGIETGPYSHKANSPGNVFKKRYGDCKDKSLLLASILNSGGIEAHLALINTDLKTKLADYTPSPILFDHAVVVAFIDRKQVWVDATIANQGGTGTNLYFPPYHMGLILKAGNNSLSNIAETKTGTIKCLERYALTDEFTPAKFSVTTTFSLNEADDIRDHIATVGISKIEKGYLDYYSKTYSKIEAADSILIKDDLAKNELTTIESYKVPEFYKLDTINQKYSASLYVDDIAQQLPSLNGQVKTPVWVNYPYSIDYTIEVNTPNGWDFADDHSSITREAYKFRFDQTVSSTELSLHYRFTYLKDNVPADQVADFKKDIKDLKDDKLSFNFVYIPDIKNVPFRLNHWMLIVTAMVTGIFVFGGLKVYHRQTRKLTYFSKSAFPPPLGGWLILLAIVLGVTPLWVIKMLIDESFYSVSKWDMVTTGVRSVFHRISLLFEGAGYMGVICYSFFCLVLVLQKRDITAKYIKGYYIFFVLFLFLDTVFTSFIQNKLLSYDVEQFIKMVVVAALWTYYLNTSDRVQETFIVPYPN